MISNLYDIPPLHTQYWTPLNTHCAIHLLKH